MKNKSIIALIIATVVVVLGGGLLIIFNIINKDIDNDDKEVVNNSIKYKMSIVSKEDENFIVEFNDDKSIVVKECKNKECKEFKETVNVNFSSSYIDLVWNNINQLYISKKTDVLDVNLNEYDIAINTVIINAIIYNDESYLYSQTLLPTNEDYELIEFTKNVVVNDDIEIIEGGYFPLEVFKNGTIFINEVATDIENDYDEFYPIDIDKDGIKELITITNDGEVSPITKHYHIYKYLEENESFYEVVDIAIKGSIESFYVDGCDIKVVYEPFEGKEGYKEEKHFSFISEDYEMIIYPVYLKTPSNAITIYKNNYLVTKIDSENYMDLIKYVGKHNLDLNSIKDDIKKNNVNSLDVVPFYSVKIKGEESSYALLEDAEVIKIVNELTKQYGNIWYIS